MKKEARNRGCQRVSLDEGITRKKRVKGKHAVKTRMNISRERSNYAYLHLPDCPVKPTPPLPLSSIHPPSPFVPRQRKRYPREASIGREADHAIIPFKLSCIIGRASIHTRKLGRASFYSLGGGRG